jgi:sterol desaturase/sphingolipid hydroxylase (fatty acid hydroxylase superfamily)
MSYLLTFIAGILSWTLTEYLLHRFWGHKIKRGLFYREHAKHHFVKDYFAPNIYKLRAALGVAAISMLILTPILSWKYAAAFTISFSSMYLFYEYVHYQLHITGPQNWYFATMSAHHFSHHFVEPQCNHGVTSTFWDRIFGTYRGGKELIQMQKRYQCNWMGGEKFSDRFGHTYEVVTK